MIWEYKTLSLPSSAQRQEMLSEMGISGWELVAFEQGLAYFKRRKPEVIEAKPTPSPEAIVAGLGVPTKAILEDLSKTNYYSGQGQRSKKK